MVQDYIKTEWVDKETVISAENMNKLEEQIDVITDDILAIKEQIDLPTLQGLTEKVESMSKRIYDLEVKLHYINPSENKIIVSEVDTTAATTKIFPEPGQVVKAMRMSEVPETSVKWRNKFSTFFGIDEEGKMTGNTNPSASTAPQGTKFEHIGNLDPTLGIHELDKIENLYAILADFDFEKAAAVEIEDIKKYFPNTVKIKYVRHMIDILNAEDEVLKTLKIDIYNPHL